MTEFDGVDRLCSSMQGRCIYMRRRHSRRRCAVYDESVGGNARLNLGKVIREIAKDLNARQIHLYTYFKNSHFPHCSFLRTRKLVSRTSLIVEISI